MKRWQSITLRQLNNMQAWCNGSMTVSNSVDKGSIPLVCAFEN